MTSVTAYIVSLSALAVMFLLSVIIANIIDYDPSHSDVGKRRLWFWICCILTPVLAFLINMTFFYGDITVPSQKASYMTAMGIGAGAAIILFIILGVILSKTTHGKLASWF